MVKNLLRWSLIFLTYGFAWGAIKYASKELPQALEWGTFGTEAVILYFMTVIGLAPAIIFTLIFRKTIMSTLRSLGWQGSLLLLLGLIAGYSIAGYLAG